MTARPHPRRADRAAVRAKCRSTAGSRSITARSRLSAAETPRRRAGQYVIEGAGAALLPGFVNTHAHSHSSLTRGSAEGLPLEGWLAVIEREQARLTDEQAYVGALATYAEALLSGHDHDRRHVHPPRSRRSRRRVTSEFGR